MDMNELINSGIELIKKESKIIDKMLTSLEKGENSKFEAYTEYFKRIKERTDKVVFDLLKKYDCESIVKATTDSVKKTKDDLLAAVTLVGFLQIEFVNTAGNYLYNVGMDSFSEEHNKELFKIYLWGINNEDISLSERKELHDFMVIRLASSKYVRSHFSGNLKNAERICDPDYNFGSLTANGIALKAYYGILNKTIIESNGYEMFEDIEPNDMFNARRRLMKYELMAICALMEKRDIVYQALEVPISDFSLSILRDASDSTEKRKEKKLNYSERIFYL